MEEATREEAIERGSCQAEEVDEISAQSTHEDTVSKLSPKGRGRFRLTELIMQALKEQISITEAMKIDEDFYKRNNDFFDRYLPQLQWSY